MAWLEEMVSQKKLNVSREGLRLLFSLNQEQVKNVDFTEAITPEPDRILRRGKQHWVFYAKIYSYAKFEGNPLNCVGANWMRNMAL